MAQPARPTVEINDFPGMLSNIDARDLPNGAAESQVNVTSVVAGELRSRLGMREVTFESE